jgi:hypothetical protein
MDCHRSLFLQWAGAKHGIDWIVIVICWRFPGIRCCDLFSSISTFANTRLYNVLDRLSLLSVHIVEFHVHPVRRTSILTWVGLIGVLSHFVVARHTLLEPRLWIHCLLLLVMQRPGWIVAALCVDIWVSKTSPGVLLRFVRGNNFELHCCVLFYILIRRLLFLIVYTVLDWLSPLSVLSVEFLVHGQAQSALIIAWAVLIGVPPWFVRGKK